MGDRLRVWTLILSPLDQCTWWHY